MEAVTVEPCQLPLRIAVSSRALFDLDASNAVFDAEGVEAYAAYQRAHETTPLAPGPCFRFVKNFLAINALEEDRVLTDVILLSRNSADTGLRVFHSIEHYDLGISRAVFTNGGVPWNFLPAFNAQLFLSLHASDVLGSLHAGIPAAQLWPRPTGVDGASMDPGTCKVAFDGDAVLFSPEAEQLYQREGLEAFALQEKNQADQPLAAGPFQPFLSALHALQAMLPAGTACPIRTALVTARSAPAHERVIKTLRAWGIRIDEAYFLGGLDKGAFLASFGADMFFDDQQGNWKDAGRHVSSGWVPPAADEGGEGSRAGGLPGSDVQDRLRRRRDPQT